MQLVSIVVPVYNAKIFLERCLESLVSQDYENYEVILVDDGSTDQSGTICDEYALKNDNFYSYHIANGGVSNARNYGMKKMNNNGYVMFVDADDYVEPDFVSTMVTLSEKYACSLVSCDFFREKDEHFIKVDEYNEEIEFWGEENKYAAILKMDGIRGYVWNKIYKKSILTEHEIQFDRSIQILEDVLFNIKYIKFVDNVLHVNKVLYQYTMNPNSATLDYEFDKDKWLSELVAIEIIRSKIPSEYVQIRQSNYNALFNESIYYWIRMYKAGKFEKPDKSIKREFKQMKSMASFAKQKYKIYYCGIMYCPFVFFVCICVGMAFRNVVRKECRRI